MQELERLTQPDSAAREALEEELTQVRKRLEELPREEQRLVEDYRKGFYADFMMREETERVRSEQTSAEERRRDLERQLVHLHKALSYQGQVQELTQRLSQGLEAMDFQQRRELLRLLVDEVMYNEGQVTIKTVIPFGSSADDVQLYPVPQGGQGHGRKSFSAPCLENRHLHTRLWRPQRHEQLLVKTNRSWERAVATSQDRSLLTPPGVLTL